MNRGRVLLLLALPALIAAVGELSARSAAKETAEATRARLVRRAARLEGAFRDLLDSASAAARCVQGSQGNSPCDATGALQTRREGSALGSGAEYRRWTGTPVEPGEGPPGPGPGFSIRATSVRTSLTARSADGPDGTYGIASFTLDSPSLRLPFGALAGGAWDADDRIAFGPEAADADAASGELRVDLRGPDGALLGTAVLAPRSPDGIAAARRRTGWAAAAVTFALLVGVLFPWARATPSLPGLAAAWAAIAAARGALVLGLVPERLLPRSLGSASLYGSSAAGGLFASPAGLLLSAGAALAAAALLRRHAAAMASSRARLALPALIGGALAAAAAVAWLAGTLVGDARLTILELGGAARSAGHAAALAALTLAILAAAGVAGAAAAAARRARGLAPRPPSGREAAAALAILSLVAVVAIYRTSDRLALDRLASEFAPQVLGQHEQRQLALQAAVREAAQSSLAVGALERPGPAASAAFDLWRSGDLFHIGFSSSLDLVDASARLRSHFAFGLPRFGDKRLLGAGWRLVPEIVPFGASHQSLLHAEMPVFAGGRPIGWVVGHVLDEPDDLPFLPWLEPYLAALGPGSPLGASGATGVPDYVRYDPDGDVVVSTLNQPPAADAAMRAAAAARRTLHVTAGTEAFVGLAREDGGSIHLLVVPDRSGLDAVGGFVRLFLLVLALAGASALTATVARPGGAAALGEALRGSFQRKLLAALLLASVVPLVGLSLFLRSAIERQSAANLAESATVSVSFVKRLVEDYAAALEGEPGGATHPVNDEILTWLRGLVGQDIHLYEDGTLAFTSKPEIFDSGLQPLRLPGEVDRAVARGRAPSLLRSERLGPSTIPMVYTRVDLAGGNRVAVLGLPLVRQQRELRRSTGRIREVLLLTTVALAGLLAVAAARVARTVAEPVRDLVDAASRIAAGDYRARPVPRTRDEIATLVRGFNAMAEALASQREDLERRRDYMEALLRHATTGVVSTDASGRVVTLNPAAAALLAGAAGGPSVGQSLVDAIAASPEMAPLVEALRRGAAAGEPREVDLAKPGGPRRLQIVRAPLPDPAGGPAGSLILLDDVTDLMRSNQLAAWAEMARSIAHEIKNPLTPIQLSTEHLDRLLEDRGLADEPQVRACLDTVLKQVRALREIAVEFSAYAKHPTLHLERVDLAAFLSETLEAYRSAPPPGIEIRERHDPAPAIAADRRVLGRAVVNLVENAFQAMNLGGVLEVRSGGDAAHGGAYLEVSDTGPGVDPQARDRLFEPYFSTKSSGTGLGLAIARRAVEAHGGRIEFESVTGRGSTFRILLPANPAA